MKKCVKCTKDLPDTALHCVFCGTKQPAAAPAGPPIGEPGAAKTVMGYSAAELLKHVPKPAAPAPAPMPAPVAAPAPLAPAPVPPAAMAATAFAQPSPFAHQAPPAMAPPAPAPAAPPPAASQARTMFMEGPQSAPQPMPAPMPQPMPAPMPYAPAPMPMHQPMPAPMPQPMPAPMPYVPAPAAPHAPPPYLASQTATRAARPVDPFAGGLQLVMIVFGVLLVAAFATPVATEPDLAFWWDGLGELEGAYKLMPIFLAAAGLLGVLLGAIPLPSGGRGIAAAALGAIPLVYASLAVNPEAEWQQIAGAFGTILIPTGLLLRSAYPSAILGRLLTTVGALAVLAVWLVPVHDKMPLQAALDVLSSDAKGSLKIATVAPLLYPVLAVVSLLVWLPGPGSAGAKVFAWLWILAALVVHFVIVLGMGDIGEGLERSPNMILFAGMENIAKVMSAGPDNAALGMLWPSGVVASAYSAFAGYGLATLLGKNLER